MRTAFSIFLIVCLATLRLQAQYYTNENMVWIFGHNSRIDFSTGTPVPSSCTFHSPESCASVSDADGHLLFYTEGRKVYDKTYTLMPGGASIVSVDCNSATQGSLIVRSISNPDRYYIFSVEGLEPYLGTGDTTGPKLYYSLIDMTLNGGLGDVVTGSAGILLNSRMGEKILAVPGDNCDMWILTHALDTGKLYAYNLNSTGLNTTPVVSYTGTMHGSIAYGFGVMKISPDRKKLVVQNTRTEWVATGSIYAQDGCELYDFDPASGIVSGCQRINTGQSEYGAEFSPDNTRLYTSSTDDSIGAGLVEISQYDITAGSTAAIIASRYLVASGSYWGSDLRLGPDGKIYFAAFSGMVTLNCITNPNSAGAACNYVPNMISLLPGTYIEGGLPNVYQAPFPRDSSVTYKDTIVCMATAGSITLTASVAGTHSWYDGATSASHVITAPGTYWVRTTSGCTYHADSFVVTAPLTDTLRRYTDTAACITTGTNMQITAPGGDSYLWYDGSTAASHTITATGSYTVQVTNGCDVLIATINARITNQAIRDTSTLVVACFPGHIALHAPAGYLAYAWHDGSTGATTAIDSPGTYWVVATDTCALVRDTFHVYPRTLTVSLGPDTAVCTPYLLDATVAGSTYAWQDGSGESTYLADHTGTYAVTVSQRGCTATSSVHVTTGHCSCWCVVPDAFSPNNDGLNDLCKPTIQPECTITDYVFSVYNRWGNLVFKSQKPREGWDGTFNGVPQDPDVFMYLLHYNTGAEKIPVQKKGDITLVK